jgi:hypothetical protein
MNRAGHPASVCRPPVASDRRILFSGVKEPPPRPAIEWEARGVSHPPSPRCMALVSSPGDQGFLLGFRSPGNQPGPAFAFPSSQMFLRDVDIPCRPAPGLPFSTHMEWRRTMPPVKRPGRSSLASRPERQSLRYFPMDSGRYWLIASAKAEASAHPMPPAGPTDTRSILRPCRPWGRLNGVLDEPVPAGASGPPT